MCLINFTEKPVIGPLSRPDRIDMGMHLTLVCTIVKGDEPVSVRWLKDGQVLAPDSDVDFTEAKNYLLLHITSVDANKHNGNYSCQAQNEAGITSRHVNVTVSG